MTREAKSQTCKCYPAMPANKIQPHSSTLNTDLFPAQGIGCNWVFQQSRVPVSIVLLTIGPSDSPDLSLYRHTQTPSFLAGQHVLGAHGVHNRCGSTKHAVMRCPRTDGPLQQSISLLRSGVPQLYTISASLLVCS